jgi:hypothetical protein
LILKCHDLGWNLPLLRRSGGKGEKRKRGKGKNPGD